MLELRDLPARATVPNLPNTQKNRPRVYFVSDRLYRRRVPASQLKCAFGASIVDGAKIEGCHSKISRRLSGFD
jgi:hypothetical protein